MSNSTNVSLTKGITVDMSTETDIQSDMTEGEGKVKKFVVRNFANFAISKDLSVIRSYK